MCERALCLAITTAWASRVAASGTAAATKEGLLHQLSARPCCSRIVADRGEGQGAGQRGRGRLRVALFPHQLAFFVEDAVAVLAENEEVHVPLFSDRGVRAVVHVEPGVCRVTDLTAIASAA